MNPLQWRLFANRKFQVQDSAENDEIATIFGINKTRAGTNYLMLRQPNGYEYESAVRYCTLIARPIEDMTDEEYTHFFGWSQNNFEKDRELIENYASNGGTMDSDGFLYLLSIGVYPFDQQDFGDTVIDTRTLTNA